MNLFKSKKSIMDENYETVKKGTTPKEENDVTKETDRFFKEVKEFQNDRLAQVKKLSKIAWLSTAIMTFIVVVMAVAIAAMMPLKTVEPFVIRVDNNTGFTDVAQPLANNKTTEGQEVDKYFLAKWVVNRESYDWQTIQNMSDTIELMSSNRVFSEYRNIITNKVTSPLFILKQDKKVMVRVSSVTFIDDVAQVRFIKFVKNANGTMAPEYPTTNWIGTIGFDYKKTISKQQERLVNPLGFQVTSYRVDPENIGGKR